MIKIYQTIRKYLRCFFLTLIGHFRKPSVGVHILNGHMLTRDICSENHAKKFSLLLKRLNKYCEFVNFEDAVSLIENRVVVNKPIVAFSFDDGFTDCYEYLIPEIEKYGIHVACFINPGFADAEERNDADYIYRFTNIYMHNDGKRPMSWTQIVDLHKRGHIIGAHTVDHYMINRGNTQELKYQIVECKRMLEEKLNYDCLYFAWPYGRLSQVNQQAIEIAISTYKYVFSQSNYKLYHSFKGKVINRRHFEAWWPISHLKYFLSFKKSYEG